MLSIIKTETQPRLHRITHNKTLLFQLYSQTLILSPLGLQNYAKPIPSYHKQQFLANKQQSPHRTLSPSTNAQQNKHLELLINDADSPHTVCKVCLIVKKIAPDPHKTPQKHTKTYHNP